MVSFTLDFPIISDLIRPSRLDFAPISEISNPMSLSYPLVFNLRAVFRRQWFRFTSDFALISDVISARVWFSVLFLRFQPNFDRSGLDFALISEIYLISPALLWISLLFLIFPP